MKRDINKLSNEKFDMLIIGGGIYGAALAWRASIENYKVALIDKNDFASGTSSNSQKIIHGGFRYLAKLDFKRIKQSLNERKRLMWIAPHLVNPLSCVIPVYDHGLKGKEGMIVGSKIYDFLSSDRNKNMDYEKHIPDCKFYSKNEIQEVLPEIKNDGILGGINWYDGFCFNTERLIISFIKSAVKNGAYAANYVSADKLIIENNKVKRVLSTDNLTNNTFDIKAENIINCTGTFLNKNFPDEKTKATFPLISGINIVTKRLFKDDIAVGLKSKDENRYYFIAPWKGKSLIGTEWFYDSKNDFFVKEDECLQFINNINLSYPNAELKLEDISYVTKGYVFGKKVKNDPSETLNDFVIEDSETHSVSGLINIIGIKYTTAVSVAEEVLKKLNPSAKNRKLIDNPKLAGGEINNLSEFKAEIHKKFDEKINNSEEIDSVLNNYGSESIKIFNLIDDWNYNKALLKAKTIFSVKEEMAVSLSDLVLRRTDIGTSEKPVDSDLKFIADVMSSELNWSEPKKQKEIHKINNHYPNFISNKINERILN